MIDRSISHLDGKTAIVTGGGTGLGRDMAQSGRLSQEGVEIALPALRQPAIKGIHPRGFAGQGHDPSPGEPVGGGPLQHLRLLVHGKSLRGSVMHRTHTGRSTTSEHP